MCHVLFCPLISESEARLMSNANIKGGDTFLFGEFDMMLITLAISTLNNLLEEMFNGTVSLCTIEVVRLNRAQVEKLCAANSQKHLVDLGIMLDCRFKEYTAFKRYKSDVASICRDLEAFNLQIEGGCIS